MIKKNKKTVVVAGGSGYVGQYITEALIKSGYFVVNLSADITRSKEVAGAAKKIRSECKSVAAVIHCAAVPLVRKPILLQKDEDFKAQFNVQVIGAFHLFKYFAPLLSDNGAFLAITSQASDPGASYAGSTGSYVPAKYALRSFLKVLAHELKDTRVYAIAPAFMPGGLNNDISPLVKKFILEKSKPGHIADPREVAKAILDMIGDKAGNFKGTSVAIPGFKTSDL